MLSPGKDLSLAKTLADRRINNIQQYVQSLIWSDESKQFSDEIHMNIGVGNQNAAAMAEKTTEPQKTLEPKTLDNLSTAMHGEAFAYLKYLLYAEHARKSGNQKLAELFERRPILNVLNTSSKKRNSPGWLAVILSTLRYPSGAACRYRPCSR
jgi:hypothetical protein